jgi:nucleoid-associated protein YgaU
MLKAKLVNKFMPAEMVTFDFNPEKLSMSRKANNVQRAQGNKTGSTPSIWQGSQPRQLSGSAIIAGDDVKDRAETLCAWAQPGGGLLGRAVGAAVGALSGGKVNLVKNPPTLMFIWGPFIMDCRLDTAKVEFTRFRSSGMPTRANVTFQLTEQPSLLGDLPTNPTSGGIAGRQSHVVTDGEGLHLIATRTYGHPGAWRSVAEVNGIDDPFRVRPGQTVYLPNPGELAGS